MTATARGTWVCRTCGKRHEGLALGFTAKTPMPWENLSWLDRRGSTLGEETCIIRRQIFFIRGLIEIPAKARKTSFVWNVWSSLSAEGFQAMLDRWTSPDRASDPAYLGLLSNDLFPAYPRSLNLKLSVQTRDLGQRPSFELEPNDHPLAVDQHRGISVDRVREINSLLLHASR